MWVETPSDYLLLFCGSWWEQGQLWTVRLPPPSPPTSTEELGCRQDSRKSCPSLHRRWCPSWEHQGSYWMCWGIRKWSLRSQPLCRKNAREQSKRPLYFLEPPHLHPYPSFLAPQPSLGKEDSIKVKWVGSEEGGQTQKLGGERE